MKQKLKQLFCRHKKTGWYTKNDNLFFNLSGEQHYEVCEKCEKTVSTRFVRHD